MNVSSFIKSVFLYNMETRLHLILISPWFRSCGLGWISWALECRSIRRVHGLGGCSSTSTFCILDIFKKIALKNVIRRLSVQRYIRLCLLYIVLSFFFTNQSVQMIFNDSVATYYPWWLSSRIKIHIIVHFSISLIFLFTQVNRVVATKECYRKQLCRTNKRASWYRYSGTYTYYDLFTAEMFLNDI